MKQLWRSYAAAATAAATWGSLSVVGRTLLAGSDGAGASPMTVSMFRTAAAALVMVGFVLLTGGGPGMRRALREEWRGLCLLGFVGIVMEGTLQLWSLQYTTAARCSIFANTAPIHTVIIARLALREKCPPKRWFGVALGLAGIVLIAASSGHDFYGSGTMLFGDLLALGSGICWGAYTVFAVGVTRRHGALVSSALAAAAAALILIPFGAPGVPAAVANLTPRGWLGILWLGVVATGIANLCWFSALRRLPAGALGAFNYAGVALTVIFAACFLREKLEPRAWIAIALIVGSIVLMAAPRAEKKGGETAQ